MTLVLASASPRRAELLRSLGHAFEVCAADLDEDALIEGIASPSRRAVVLALEKARAVAALRRGARILAADTMVFLGEESLAKPRDAEHALWMLSRLSGASHEVVTGVAVREPDGAERSGFASTRVTFARWPPSALVAYARSTSPLDKAGAYGLQDLAGGYVTGLDGPADNVVGLPRALVARLLAPSSTIPHPGLPGSS